MLDPAPAGRRSSPATSRPRSCITNALYGALGVMAAGQCTMNNFTFGNARYQYYETICGRLPAPAPASTAPASCRRT